MFFFKRKPGNVLCTLSLQCPERSLARNRCSVDSALDKRNSSLEMARVLLPMVALLLPMVGWDSIHPVEAAQPGRKLGRWKDNISFGWCPPTAQEWLFKVLHLGGWWKGQKEEEPEGRESQLKHLFHRGRRP